MNSIFRRVRRGVETSLIDDALRDGGNHLLSSLQQAGLGIDEMEETRTKLSDRLAELAEQQAQLRSVLVTVARMEVDLTRRAEYREEGWPTRLEAIEAGVALDRRRGTAIWINAFGGALLDQAFDECERLAAAGLDLMEGGWLGPRAMFEAAAAARGERDFDGVLEWLARGAPLDHNAALPDWMTSKFNVLRARLALERLPWDPDSNSEEVLAIHRSLDRAIEIDPDSALPEACRSALERATGDLKGAMVSADRARYADVDAPDGDLEDAICHLQSDRVGEADQLFLSAASLLAAQPAPALGSASWLRSQHPLLDLHLAVLLHGEYRLNEALASSRSAQAGRRITEPQSQIAAAPVTEAEILDTLQDAGNTVEPGDQYRARLTAGKELYWDRQYVRARAQLEMAINASPTDPEVYWYLADINLVTSGTDQAPYVDPHRVNEAIKAWSIGAPLAAWDDRPAERWALLSRAMMAEQKARAVPEQREALWWQAVVLADRALHYSPDSGVAWALLSRYLRYKGFAWAAKTAADEAVRLGPTEPTVLEQGIIVNISFGELDAALELLAKRREVTSTIADEPWHQAVEASILLRRGRFDEALSLIDGALTAEPNRVWYREIAARLAILAGEADAMERVRFVLEARNDLDLENFDSFIWAAIYAGDHADAATMLRAAKASGALAPVAIAELEAQLLLADGEIGLARVAFQATIAQAINPGDLNTYVAVDFAIARTFAERWGDPHAIEELLSELEDHFIPDALEALESKQEEYPLLYDVAQHAARGSWEHAGACVSLARMLSAERKWLKAADWYQRVADDDHYPEAQSALLEVYRQRAGEAEIAADIEANEDATAQVRSEGGSIKEVATSRAWTRLNAATDLSFDADFPAIRVTISETLIPPGAEWDRGHPFFEDHLPDARDRVTESNGWPIPGVRVYSDPTAPYGQYQIEIPDEPPAVGSVEPMSYFCPMPGALLDVDDEDRQDIENPPILGVTKGTWVDAKRVPAIPPTVELWSVWEYIARHVEFITRANLGSLVTLDGIADWVADRVPDDLAARALPDVDTYVRLGAVVRSLLDDEIPVSNAEDLVRSFEMANREPDADLVANEVRRSLAHHFKVKDQRVIAVPPEIERTLASLSDHSSLKAPSERAVVGTIEAVGSRVVDSPNRTIIAIDDPLARLQLTALVDAVDPAVRVAMTSELADDAMPSEHEILLGPDFTSSAQRVGSDPVASTTSFGRAVGIFNQAAMDDLRRRVAEAIASGGADEDPDVVGEAYALGYYLFTAGAYDRALEAMRYAASARPSAQNLRAAGIAEQHLGNYPAAIDFYREALGEESSDFLSLLFLAESLLHTGESEEAIELLAHARDLVSLVDPDNAFASRIGSMLDYQRGADHD